MQPMKQLRIWHAFIAVFATAAYLSEDVEPLHQLLGYSVVILISGRLLMAMFGAGVLGLQRFYPKFRDLKLETAVTHPAISRTLLLGIAAALLGAATTGIFMDKGQTLQTIPAMNSGASFSAFVVSDDSDRRPASTRKGDEGDDDEEGWLGEVHEFFANLLMGVVALHVTYLLLFKWPLARFMLFVRESPKAIAPKP